MRLSRKTRIALTGAGLALALTAAAVTGRGDAASAPHPGPVPNIDWTVAGHDISNTRDAAGERLLGPTTVSRLTPAWSVSAAGGLSVTPADDGATLYYPDLAGQFWAVAANTGQVRWSHSITDYTGTAGDVVRDSPAVHGNELVFGDSTFTAMAGARVLAVDKRTGAKLWQTVVDAYPVATVTSSPVIIGDTIYVGISSSEEFIAVKPGYHCCSFRGSVVALDARTGRILWQTHTVPAGYSGGGVWGSTPAVDPRAGLLYVATGNNYSVPDGICDAPNQQGCSMPVRANHADSIMALDMATGAIRWATPTIADDVYTAKCDSATQAGCGSDFDFASGPNLIRLPSGRMLVGVGQKSGVYWALDPHTGKVVWHTPIGPGSTEGGIQWGSATDGSRIYVAIGNYFGKPYQIRTAHGAPSTIAGGSWAALDAATGRILWQVADPQQAADIGYVTTANGVVYAGSTASTGDTMYALDAANGRILWRFASGTPVVSGTAIVHGWLYWGSGFKLGTACPTGQGPMRVCINRIGRMFAFHLPANSR